MLDHLRAEGFNRLSMGVQDFNKEVQRTVNRSRILGYLCALLNHARDIGFTSTNIDLITVYRKQTPEASLSRWRCDGTEPRSFERL